MQWTGAEDLDYFTSQAFLLKTFLTNYRATSCIACKDWKSRHFQCSDALTVTKLNKENITRRAVTNARPEVQDHFSISCIPRQIYILIIYLT